MKYQFEQNSTSQEADEEQLKGLIKQAGDEARARKQEAMNRHVEKLRVVIAEAISRR